MIEAQPQVVGARAMAMLKVDDLPIENVSFQQHVSGERGVFNHGSVIEAVGKELAVCRVDPERGRRF